MHADFLLAQRLPKHVSVEHLPAKKRALTANPRSTSAANSSAGCRWKASERGGALRTARCSRRDVVVGRGTCSAGGQVEPQARADEGDGSPPAAAAAAPATPHTPTRNATTTSPAHLKLLPRLAGESCTLHGRPSGSPGGRRAAAATGAQSRLCQSSPCAQGARQAPQHGCWRSGEDELWAPLTHKVWELWPSCAIGNAKIAGYWDRCHEREHLFFSVLRMSSLNGGGSLGPAPAS